MSQIGSDNIERPCGYHSKILSLKDSKQQPGMRERAALIHALRHWRPYLVGKEFTLRTDHRPNLKITQGGGNVYDTLSDEIQQYQPFKMEYLQGKKMFVDALSRHPVSAVAPVQSDPVQRFPSDGELRKLQDHDPLLGPAIGVHLQKFSSPVPSAVANIVANTFMRHNVLCHETPHGPAAVVPQAIRQLLLYYTHDLAGHFSHPYVMDKLRGWYWPQMSVEVLKYCNSCDVCSHANASRPSTRMPFKNFPQLPAWEIVYTSICCPCHVQLQGKSAFAPLWMQPQGLFLQRQ